MFLYVCMFFFDVHMCSWLFPWLYLSAAAIAYLHQQVNLYSDLIRSLLFLLLYDEGEFC